MTHVINAYLRRHDTYRSWFEFADGDRVVRRTIRNPKDITFVRDRARREDIGGSGASTSWPLRAPLQWDCFRFGLIQRADHFTFYMSVDHLHVDAMFMGLVFVEIHMMYAALVAGAAPFSLPEAGSYDDYCVRQHQFTSALTLGFATGAQMDHTSHNETTEPCRDSHCHSVTLRCACEGDLLTVQLMDEEQSNRFESACIDAGARFIGGVFAAAALAEYDLTGSETLLRHHSDELPAARKRKR